MKKQLRGSLLLFIAATIWGSAFVAQSVAMDYIGPLTFNAVRSLVGSIVLVPVILVMSSFKKRDDYSEKLYEIPLETDEVKNKSKKENNKILIAGGVSCGLLLTASSLLQQIGIQYTTAGKAGFITACYILIVPILGKLIFKRKCPVNVVAGVVLAVIGLYMLCMTETLTLGKGDVLIFMCSIAFAFHILVIDYFSPKTDGVKMSCIQFFVCGIISAVLAFIFEKPDYMQILSAWQPILYAGVLSSGVAYTLQIIGQKELNPTAASLICSMESCIAVIAGWIILGERMSAREIMGCVVMFAAIILAQLDIGRYKKEKSGNSIHREA